MNPVILLMLHFSLHGHNLVVDEGFTSFKNLEFPAPDQVH